MEIGRASCRARVKISEVAGALNKKTTMGLESVEGGLTLRVKALVTNVTSTKTVAVFTTPGADVPRTVNWVGPKGTVAATCTGKEPAALAATVPGVAWKPAGRLGKSM